MADEFGEMFDRVTKGHVDARREEQRKADAAAEQARYNFDLKAKCLREVAKPTLEAAKASFAQRGIDLVIDGNIDLYRPTGSDTPEVRFGFRPSIGGNSAMRINERMIYFLRVTHTKGGLQIARQMNNNYNRPETADIVDQFGTRNADELTREIMVKIIENALSDATR